MRPQWWTSVVTTNLKAESRSIGKNKHCATASFLTCSSTRSLYTLLRARKFMPAARDWYKEFCTRSQKSWLKGKELPLNAIWTARSGQKIVVLTVSWLLFILHVYVLIHLSRTGRKKNCSSTHCASERWRIFFYRNKANAVLKKFSGIMVIFLPCVASWMSLPPFSCSTRVLRKSCTAALMTKKA